MHGAELMLHYLHAQAKRNVSKSEGGNSSQQKRGAATSAQGTPRGADSGGGGAVSSGTPGSLTGVAASVFKLPASFIRRANELAEVAIERGVPSSGSGDKSRRKSSTG